MSSQINLELIHNHPPTTGIVQGCPFCISKGNIFENGVLKDKIPDLSIMYAFKNYQYNASTEIEQKQKPDF